MYNSKIYRCKCINLTNNNICKNKTKNPFYINKKPICYFHYSYYRSNYVIIIQKYYKGYKQRKLLNIIYKRLPDDIQRKILKIIREKYYYNNYIKLIGNIIEKKINNTLSCIENKLNIIDTTNPYLMEELYNYFNCNNENFYKNFKLYSNYYYCLKKKYELEKNYSNELEKNYSNFMRKFYFKIIMLENNNYQKFYYLLTTIYYKIDDYFNLEIFYSSEA